MNKIGHNRHDTMDVEEFKKLIHKSRTYNDVESRVKLGSLSQELYWTLYDKAGITPKRK